MKKKIITIFVFWISVLFLNLSMVQAQILKIKEIPAVGKRTYELSTMKTNYVDINSSFDIRLNKDSLRKCISKEVLVNNDKITALVEKMKMLQVASDSIMSASEAFMASFQTYQENVSDTNHIHFALRLSKLASVELSFKNNFITPYKEIRKRYSEMILARMDRPLIFHNIAEEIKKNLTIQLDSALKAEGIFVQVGAWIVTKAGNNSIHLEGFDEYPLGAFYEWKTINLQLDSSQVKELDAMNNKLGKNDQKYDEIFKNIGQEYSNILLGLLSPVKDSTDKILTTVNGTIQKAITTRKDLEGHLKAIQSSVNDYQAFIKTKIDSYKSENIKETDKFELLLKFNTDLDDILSIKDNYSTEIMTSINMVLKEVIETPLAIKDSLIKLQGQVSSLFSNMGKKLTDAKGGLSSMVYGAKINSDLFVFGEKVKKLAIDAVPSSTSFSLKYTGKREPGDQVILKVGAGTPSLTKAKDLEVIYINMLAAEPHIKMAIAYDFAWPVSRIKDVPPNGPSYSILYKFRSRNPIYRNVFDFGLGLNFATFDFNKDNIPEIATGFCASLFRDYLQAGWGFNFSTNIGYYFVGIRIPVSINNIYFSNSSKE